MAAESPLHADAAATALPPELELTALRRVRARLRWQRWLFALGVTCIALLFSFRISFEGGRISHFNFLLTEEPATMGSVAALGALAWFLYFRLGRARG
jgi:hypothetical protein